ncbi:homeodomain transcription factor [Flagelloscypha sp. PMI_526]|nr:homeodomain transcription factor [Flagelloscypha sp. PMI_526]
MSASKKPRHRHTSEQLEQLNSLYSIDDHPSLEQRQILAEALGMETKTVNSWFQNKRASQAKKANRMNAKRGSVNGAAGQDSDDYDPDSSAVKARNRLLPDQLDYMRQYYQTNDMPNPQERDILASQLGLSTQTVTNWFQNQRSLSKQPEEHAAEIPRHYAAYPPPSSHPSLPSLPPASTHPSIPIAPIYQRPPSVSPEISGKSALRRSTTPYTPLPNAGRRRSRPEPHQLAALTALYNKSANPTIHDRTILAVETGMDVEKVSNWFRNMRQNGKRRQRSGESDADMDGDGGSEHDFLSSPRSSPGPVELAFDDRRRTSNSTRSPESDMGSEEEQEAVTPPPPSVHGGEQSESPPFESTHETRFSIPHEWVDNDPLAQADLDKRSPVDVEGALLLLGFHSSYPAET